MSQHVSTHSPTPAPRAASTPTPWVPLDTDALTSLREAARIMALSRLSFVGGLPPEVPCSQMQMMRIIHRWSASENHRIWSFALSLTTQGLTGEALKKQTAPDTMILGTLAGLAVMLSAERLEGVVERTRKMVTSQTRPHERALGLMLEASLGTAKVEGVLQLELQGLARRVHEQKNERRIRAEKVLLRRINHVTSTSRLNTGACDGSDIGHHAAKKLMVPAAPRHLSAALPRRSSACSTPQGMLSRRSSHSSQALGSPWLEAGSPVFDGEWDLVELNDG